MDSESTVVGINSLRGSDTIAVCEEIIDSVKSGRVSGLMFAIRRNGGHQWGVTGEYRKHPLEVAMVAAAFFNKYSAKSGTSIARKIGTICMAAACIGMAIPTLNVDAANPHKALYDQMFPNMSLRFAEKELGVFVVERFKV